MFSRLHAAGIVLHCRISHLVMVFVLLSEETMECGQNDLLCVSDGNRTYFGVYGKSRTYEIIFKNHVRDVGIHESMCSDVFLESYFFMDEECK